MPEYLAPGVFVEETSFRSKSIEGVSTTTTGLIGACRYGPVDQPADIITSLAEFERTYAGGGKLCFSAEEGSGPWEAPESHNFLWHGVRAFFTEGGKRLYVTRVFRPLTAENPKKLGTSSVEYVTEAGKDDKPFFLDGRARPLKDDGTAVFSDLDFSARFPGSASNLIVRFIARAAQNIFGAQLAKQTGSPVGPKYLPTFGALKDRDVVYVTGAGSPISDGFYLASFNDTTMKWSFTSEHGNLTEDNLTATPESGQGSSIYPIAVTVNVLSDDRAHDLGTWADLPLDPAHETAGEADSLCARFAKEPSSLSEARSLPLIITAGEDATGLSLLNAMFIDGDDQFAISDADVAKFGAENTLVRKLGKGIAREIALTGGNDGHRPGSSEFEGKADATSTTKTGLKQLEDIEDISIIAAPGCTADYAKNRDDINATLGMLINHAERMRYRIAVLDCPPDMSIAEVRQVRAKLDSKHAALYYPWVTVMDPITRRELNLPPSGFVAGIYARNDVNRAVYKAPANEVVSLAIGFEQILNKAQQEVLNPEGVNCFRFFEGRGFRLWGARTISSDPEWKYVNLRRYFAYLERSIDKGTQWAVFEPNGEQLWANVRRTIEDFLLNEFQSGALLGDKPDKAYFVKCDRTTMTQNDLDNGRLICLIGVAALKPAEFVIFRIGQWTADRKS